MTKRTMQSRIQSRMPSKTEVTGHVRRAQRRLSRAFGSHEPTDIFLQAAVGTVAASFALRLIRYTPAGALIARIAPMAVFAAIYQRLSTER